jgi:replication initiation and membrane attachment protein DnaB
MLTVFWDNRGTIHHEYMVRVTRINSKTYMKTIKKLQGIDCVHREKSRFFFNMPDPRLLLPLQW